MNSQHDFQQNSDSIFTSNRIKHDWAIADVNLHFVMKVLCEMAYLDLLNEDALNQLWDALDHVLSIAYRHTVFRDRVERYGFDGAHDAEAWQEDELYDHGGPVRTRAWAEVLEEDSFLPSEARRDIGEFVPPSAVDYVWPPDVQGHPRHGTDAATQETRASTDALWRHIQDLRAAGFIEVKRDELGRMVTRQRADGSPSIVYVSTPAGDAQVEKWNNEARNAAADGVEGRLDTSGDFTSNETDA